jgi:hypothetical protein
MAIVEYLLHRNEQGHKIVPPFIIDGGHWWNPVDFTMVGWIDDVRDYYVPDTLIILSKEEFANRLLSMHNVNPLMAESQSPEAEPTPMTNEQVIDIANEWYDKFTQTHTGS